MDVNKLSESLEDDPVVAPLALLGHGVGEEDDMWWFEDHHAAGVLGVEVAAVLEELGHAVEVVCVVSLCPGDVEDDNAGLLLHVAVLHVVEGACKGDGSMLTQQVACEARLALVAYGVVDPQDVAVIWLSSQQVEHLLLPLTGLEVLVPWQILHEALVGSDASVITDEHAR